MRCVVDIDCDNAAFGDTFEERAREIAYILDDCREIVERLHYTGPVMLFDSNGNSVGSISYVQTAAEQANEAL
jgi:hypothetical protein